MKDESVFPAFENMRWPTWKPYGGLSKRELFAAIIHHAQISGNIANNAQDIPENMPALRASAVREADALLAALAEKEGGEK